MVQKLKTRELNRLTVEAYKKSKKQPIILVLDNIRSSYNVGAIFRTADGLSVEKLFLCGITPTPPNKEIYKTAIGAEQSVDWTYFEDNIEAIHTLKKEGYVIVALEQCDKSQNLMTVNWELGTKFALVLGNEVDGVDAKILELCDHFIEIPQFGTKHSFNVSVACGILLWDIFKTLNK
jgi:tRNA G18 (ribose-2'-O)-methylase SpoU